MYRTQALEIMKEKLKLAQPRLSEKKLNELAELALATAEGDIGMEPPSVKIRKSAYYSEFESSWEERLGTGRTFTR